MFVACPHCGFLVAAQGGNGLRCPRCGSAIDPKLARPLDSATVATPAEADAVEATEAAATKATATIASAAVAEAAPAVEAPRRRRGMHAPSFARRHAAAPARTGRRREWAIAAVLAGVLLLQLLLAQRETLAADAHWRPLISSVCSVLRCAVPAWREPAAFTMLQRSVQPKPGAAGVLHVSASFRNDARWPQPWPTVLLTLSDMDGRQVGLRAFKPEEYRGKGNGERIAPGQSASIELDVVEPARQVVAFTFDFQ